MSWGLAFAIFLGLIVAVRLWWAIPPRWPVKTKHQKRDDFDFDSDHGLFL